jgi:hypothetical protein
MMSDKLPAVLQGRGAESSISMERALNQISALLVLIESDDDNVLDRVEASLDDVGMMLRHIER